MHENGYVILPTSPDESPTGASTYCNLTLSSFIVREKSSQVTDALWQLYTRSEDEIPRKEKLSFLTIDHGVNSTTTATHEQSTNPRFASIYAIVSTRGIPTYDPPTLFNFTDAQKH